MEDKAIPRLRIGNEEASKQTQRDTEQMDDSDSDDAAFQQQSYAPTTGERERAMLVFRY